MGGLFAGIFLEHQNAPEKKYNDLAIAGGYILPRQKGGFEQDRVGKYTVSNLPLLFGKKSKRGAKGLMIGKVFS
jgi:hypothetical protein